MRRPPSTERVVGDLELIAQLLPKLGKEYAFTYEAGYLGIHRGGQHDELVRHIGASDPVGEIVCSRHYENVRDHNYRAARKIADALDLLRSAGYDLLTVTTDDALFGT